MTVGPIVAERARPRPGEKQRRQSGTAAWHMSKEAVTKTLEDVYEMTDNQVHEMWVRQRWGSRQTVVCPHCGTIDRHHWRKASRRWKGAACDKTFSVTSGTPFAQHKRTLKQLTALMLSWVNGTSGVPALQTRRNTGGRYNAVFVNQHKLREAVMRMFNVGLLCGDIEMDGVHISGRNAKGKRGKPQVTLQPKPSKESHQDQIKNLQDVLQAQAHKTNEKAPDRKAGAGAKDGTYGQTLDAGRRIVICARTRSGIPGVGGRRTRVSVGRTEGPAAVNATIRDFIAVPESVLNTDMAKAYVEPGKQFFAHLSVEHARELVGPNGENTNLGEEFARRHKRAERGMYLNIEKKYMLDYGAESAWRSDTRRLGTGGQLEHLMALTLRNGLSRFWRGFTRGQHREVEFIAGEGEVKVAASGPKKGQRPNAQLNGRPPR